MPVLHINRVNGVALHVEQHGHGFPLVYVHGGFACLARRLGVQPADVSGWRDEFAGRYTVLSYDRRGCSRSDCPPDGYDPVNQARDLACVLDALGVARAHVFASSAGGPIALCFAAAHPARVRSLTIHGSSLTIVRPGDSVCDTASAAHQLVGTHGAAAAFRARPVGVEVCFDTAWSRRQAAADGRLTDFLAEQNTLIARAAGLPVAHRARYYAAEAANIHAYRGIDLRPRAAALRVPTLVLHGNRDQVFPVSEGRALAEAIPAAQFQSVTAGHGPVFTSGAARAHALGFMLDHD